MSEFLRCRNCKHDKGKCVGSSRRGGHKNCFEPREMTNADRIRQMTDKELAEFIEKCEDAGYNDSSIARDKNDQLMDMLDWLKQPAEEILRG